MRPNQEGHPEQPSTLAHLDSGPWSVGLQHQLLPQRARAFWPMPGLGECREGEG